MWGDGEWEERTFWRVINGVLHIFHDLFFPDDFLNLLLGLFVERVGVEQCHLALLFRVRVPLMPHHALPHPMEAERVGHGIRQLRLLSPYRGENFLVPQRLQTDHLHVGAGFPPTRRRPPIGRLARPGSSVTRTRCVPLRLFHQHPQHGIFLDLALLEGLGIIHQLDVVVKEGLERRLDVGVAFNDGFEVGDGDFLPDIDGDEIVRNGPFGRGDGNGDEPASTGQPANQVP